MMVCPTVFTFILTFAVVGGTIIKVDEDDDIDVTVNDSEIRVTGSFRLGILNETRGQVLEKIRVSLEVSPELVQNPNVSVKTDLRCLNSRSEAYRQTPVTRVKRLDSTTKLYLDFSLPDVQCSDCFNCRHWNFTVFLIYNQEKLETYLKKQLISFEKLEAFFKDTDCDYDASDCLPWRTNGSLDNFESCKYPYCEEIPRPRNKTTYMTAKEDETTHWTSRDIYGSGSSCSMNLLMATMLSTHVTVSMVSSNGGTPMLRRKFDSNSPMNWTVVKIPVGRVDEVFRLTMCIKTLYIAAIQRIWLENCTDVQETGGCSKDDFRCSTGKCIPRDKLCDLNPDCPLQDDEDKGFCDSQGYRYFCDVDKDNCSWSFDPVCQFTREEVIKYNPNAVKNKYCSNGQKDYALFASTCDNAAVSSLRSPVLQPFNASKDCKLRLWYRADLSDTIEVILCLNESNCVSIKKITSWDILPKWKRESVSIPHRYQPFEIRLQLAWRVDFSVALDQISFTSDCFTTSDVWHNPLMEEVSKASAVGGDPDYILAVVGVAAGVVLAVITVVVIFSVFKKRRTFKSNGSCQNILPSSTASSGLDGKCSFPVDISDASSADSERQSLVPSNLAVSSISPYYEWTEDKIRDIPREKIKLVKLLGKGAFGEVYYGLLADVSRLRKDLPIAVKKLITLCPEQTKAELFFEAVTLSKFSHRNIVRFLGISTDDEDQSMYLLLELMEGGDLRTFIRESRPKQPHEPSYLTLHDLLKLGMDVSRGCHYLEQNKFIHRDIAARNCLLTEKGPNRVAKIGDFGMARDVLRTNYYRKNGRAMVPVKWMPPESFLDGIFTSKTDVWAFGVVLWELFTMGHVPYPGKSNDDVMKYVKGGGRLERPPLCPAPVYNLMMQCWQVNAEFRPNFSSIETELERIYNEEEFSSLITYEDIMGISLNNCDKEHVTSGSVTYASDITLSNASLKLLAGSDNI